MKRGGAWTVFSKTTEGRYPMARNSSDEREIAARPRAARFAYLDMFLISFLILFFELACIRWFGSMVVFLTFFTNIVLMACFLGMSVGCLSASAKTSWIRTVVPLALVTA